MKSTYFSLYITVLLALLVSSCADNDFKNINSDVITENNYKTGVEYFTVSTENKLMKAIQTSGLSSYQLGEYSQDPFGKVNASIISQVSLPNNNPVFGSKSQDNETKDNYDEKETVVSVKLNIPFFSTGKTTQSNDEKKSTTYTLDSIYGNKKATFSMKVTQSLYYLRNIESNLEKPKVYFSNLSIDNSLRGVILADKSNIEISNQEIVQNKFDDPSTSDDESKEEDKRLSPRLSVELEKSFFQTHILDKEGSSELSNQNAFNLYFKGIIIESANFSNDLLMLLDFSKASIEIVYEYKTTKDSKDYTKKDRVEFPLTGIKANMFSFENETITDNGNGTITNEIFLQGGKRFLKVDILNQSVIDKMKNEDWLINDAVLSFKVKNPQDVKNLPNRLYIYNLETGTPLIDYTLDVTTNNNNVNSSKTIHLGTYNKDTNSYDLHLTNHITNVVRRGAKNVSLGVVVSQNIQNNIEPIEYIKSDDSLGKTSKTDATTPLSVVLYGNNNSIEVDKRLQLKITYSKPTY